MNKAKIWASLHPFYESGPVLGRTMANRDFIRAFLCKAEASAFLYKAEASAFLRKTEASAFFEAFHFFLPTPDDVSRLEAELKKEFPRLHGQGRFSVRLRRTLPEALATTDYYCFHLSDPFTAYSELICLRNRYSRVIFPVTAPTHSLSYREFGQSLLGHLWPGISKRDAVVATSRCGREVVAALYAGLRRNYHLPEQAFPAPHIPVIPLGVTPADFPAPSDRSDDGDSLRSRTRADLGVGKDSVIFLILARISYQAKMDLLPVLHAFKRAEAAGLPPGGYHFLLAGWESEQDHFGSDIEKFCANLGINCTVIRRPDDERRKALYAAADVFVSPVDNVQETFGLTMLEAAVSSLPVIASDFDGYKELVVGGETGLLVPTLGPENTMDTNISAAVLPASEYHLRLAQQCVVDVSGLGKALARLGTDSALRRVMGAKGRSHALGYAWENIIERYLTLWSDLNALPLSPEEEAVLRRSSHPAQVDYGRIFSGYYSATLGGIASSESGNPARQEQRDLTRPESDAPARQEQEDPTGQERKVQWSKRGEAVYRGKDFPVLYEVIADGVPQEALKKLLLATRKPLPLPEARKIAQKLAKEHGAAGDSDFMLLWALKHDLLEFVEKSIN